MAFGSFDSNGKRDFGTVSEINMVPLIDVMLVLLVIFIITAPLMTNSISLNLPKVSATADENKPDALTISIKENGDLYLNDKQSSEEEIEAEFAKAAEQDKKPQVRFRADTESKYGAMAPLMANAQKVGLNMAFVTSPDSTQEASDDDKK